MDPTGSEVLGRKLGEYMSISRNELVGAFTSDLFSEKNLRFEVSCQELGDLILCSNIALTLMNVGGVDILKQARGI